MEPEKRQEIPQASRASEEVLPGSAGKVTVRAYLQSAQWRISSLPTKIVVLFEIFTTLFRTLGAHSGDNAQWSDSDIRYP